MRLWAELEGRKTLARVLGSDQKKKDRRGETISFVADDGATRNANAFLGLFPGVFYFCSDIVFVA